MLFQLIIILVVLIILIISISRWGLHPFIALILAAISLGLLVGMDGKTAVDVLLNGFGSTLKWIAIVVILEVLAESKFPAIFTLNGIRAAWHV